MLAKGIALSAVAVALFLLFCVPRHRSCDGSPIDRTRSDAQTVRSAAQMYLAEKPEGPCPDVAMLLEHDFLSWSGPTEDAWGMPFLVVCDGEDVSVSSVGPDGIFDTEDDVL